MKNGDYLLAVAPDDYPGKKYRGRYCSEHTLVYWQHYGIIPKDGEVIHHVDGNKHNNRIENLILLNMKKHSSEHAKKRGKAYVELICPGCQKQFIIRKYKSYLTKRTEVTCCSKECVGKYTALSKDQKQERKQNMFIREFICH